MDSHLLSPCASAVARTDPTYEVVLMIVNHVSQLFVLLAKSVCHGFVRHPPTSFTASVPSDGHVFYDYTYCILRLYEAAGM